MVAACFPETLVSADEYTRCQTPEEQNKYFEDKSYSRVTDVRSLTGSGSAGFRISVWVYIIKRKEVDFK